MDEPKWSDAPPTTRQPRAYSLKRTSDRPITGICLSRKPTGAETHFHRGRTRPHVEGGTCPACLDGQTTRWKGYLAMYDEPTRTIWIHEFTPVAFTGIQDGLTAYGDLRGHWIRFERIRPTPNAPLSAKVGSLKIADDKLPPEPNIREVLLRIWDDKEATTQTNATSDDRADYLRTKMREKRNGTPSTP